VARGAATGALLGWNVLGLLNLVVAVSLGAMSAPGPIRLFAAEPGSGIMTTLPWIIIPCFLVPALAFVHLTVLWRLREPGSDRAARPARYAA